MNYFKEQKQNIALFLLRLSLGWLFFYAGLSKIIDSKWSAAGYLSNANTFPDFFAMLAQPGVIEVVNIMNEWGLLLVGVGLIFGLFTRVAAFGGVVLMILYYLPVSNFPLVEHGYIVDDHIVYVAALFVIIATQAGKNFGLDKFVSGLWKR